MNMLTVRQRARDTVAKYNPTGLVPFPFHSMAKQLGDVKILFVPLDPEAGVSGSVFMQSGTLFVVIVDERKPEARQYFTMAHEFGHYFLHEYWLRNNPVQGVVDHAELLDGQGVLPRPDMPNRAKVDFQKEREANIFAAELLMPEEKVQAFWELTQDVTACARAFQVSVSAMAIRLERLQLAT